MQPYMKELKSIIRWSHRRYWPEWDGGTYIEAFFDELYACEYLKRVDDKH